MHQPGEITAVLQRVNRGEQGSLGALWLACYDEIRGMAARAVAQGALAPEVQPTLVVHEIFLKLHAAPRGKPWQNRRHYFGSAARAILEILTDAARRRAVRTKARSEVAAQSAANAADPATELLASPEEFARLGEALAMLDADHPRVAEVVWLRFVGGLSDEAIAELLGVSRRTVQNDWLFAKALLRERLEP
jgi:RNA polymerase sigma factor (TIGR02999 family)